jgi:hypothetical protein
MMPLVMNHSQLSKAIRDKKSKIMRAAPDFIDTSPTPDLNAQDIYDLEQAGRVEGTLSSPEKINADLTNIDENQVYDGVGVSPEDKKRLGRLRMYLDALPLWASNESRASVDRL